MAFDLSSLTSLLKGNGGVQSDGTVIGVDIGSSALKIVQIKEVKGVPTLETYGELQLGPYEGIDIGRGAHLTQQKTVEALVDILREAGATGKGVAFALSYGSSFTITITVPTRDQEAIGALIPVEARKYVPVPLSKVTLDWFPLAVKEEENVTQVLISAVYNEAFSRYETIMKAAGLTILQNEIEIFSTIRSVLSPEDEHVAIFDFGASSTRMYLVRKGTVEKTHSVPLSGVEITHALEESLSIDFRRAEELKRSVGIHGTDDDPRIQKALSTSLKKGLRELHTVVTRYEESAGTQLDKIILTGSGALLQGLDIFVKDIFSCPTHIADPFSKVAYPAFLEDTLKEAGPSFAVAIGVALRALQKK